MAPGKEVGLDPDEEAIIAEGGSLGGEQPMKSRRRFAVPTIICCLLVYTILMIELSTGIIPRKSRTSVNPGGRAQAATPAARRYCLSDDCATVSRLFTSSRSLRVDPCHNFYDYVCSGRRRKAHSSLRDAQPEGTANAADAIMNHAATIPSPRSDQTAIQKASAFVRLCIERYEHYRHNEKIMNSFLDSLPWADGDEHVTTPLGGLIAQLILYHNMPVVFKICVDNSFVWKELPILRLKLDDDFKIWYKRRRRLVSNGTRYKMHILDVLSSVHLSGRKNVEHLYSSIEHAEEKVAKYLNKAYVTVAEAQRWFIVKLEHLGYLIPNTTDNAEAWRAFVLQHVMKEKRGSIFIRVATRDTWFLRELFKSMNSAMIHAFVQWEIIRQLDAASGQVRRHLKPDKWYCFRQTSSLLGHALSASYFSRPKLRTVLNESLDMAVSIWQGIIDAMNTSTWLNGTLLKKGIHKLHSLKWSLGYPSGLQDSAAIDRFYQYYPNVAYPFLTSFLLTARAHIKNVLQLVATPRPISTMIEAGDFATSAAYKYALNAIVVTPAMMLPPNLCQEAPAEVNYGGLGHVMSFHMMRAYDWLGLKLSEKARPKPLWIDAVRSKHQREIDCLTNKTSKIHQRKASPGPVANYLAGIMAIEPVYMAYRNAVSRKTSLRIKRLGDLSGDKLFFFAWCYSLCSTGGVGKNARDDASLRCNLPLTSMKQFSAAFQCPLSSYMNPKETCTYW